MKTGINLLSNHFLKKDGKPFTAKEVAQTRDNYLSNSKHNNKPRNAFKVDRAIEKVKSKEKKK